METVHQNNVSEKVKVTEEASKDIKRHGARARTKQQPKHTQKRKSWTGRGSTPNNLPHAVGRYKYCNLPQGHMAARDANTARYDETTKDFEPIERCMDNTILWDDNPEENFKSTCNYAAKINQESKQKNIPWATTLPPRPTPPGGTS